MSNRWCHDMCLKKLRCHPSTLTKQCNHRKFLLTCPEFTIEHLIHGLSCWYLLLLLLFVKCEMSPRKSTYETSIQRKESEHTHKIRAFGQFVSCCHNTAQSRERTLDTVEKGFQKYLVVSDMCDRNTTLIDFRYLCLSAKRELSVS